MFAVSARTTTMWLLRVDALSSLFPCFDTISDLSFHSKDTHRLTTFPFQPLSLLVPLHLPHRLLSLRRHPRPMLPQPPRLSPPKHPPRLLSLPLLRLPQTCPLFPQQSLLLACLLPVALWMSLTSALSRSQSLPLPLRLLRRLLLLLLRPQPPPLRRNRLLDANDDLSFV